MTVTRMSGQRRAHKRQQAISTVSAVALRHFLRQGFDATTVEAIVANSGISRRSFFRLFDSKEALVLDQLEHLGTLIRAELASRPADEAAVESLRRCFDVLDRLPRQDRLRFAQIGRLIQQTPSLRALLLDRHANWEAALAAVLSERLRSSRDDILPRTLATAAYGAMRVAVRAARAKSMTTLIGPHMDKAFAALANFGALQSPRAGRKR